jgi:hypothetical protein
MKIILHCQIIICLLFICNSIFSQQVNDTTISPHHLFPNFTDGIVYFKNGQSAKAKFNYDTYQDQMQFLGTDDLVMILQEPEKLFKVSIANREFYFINNSFLEIVTNDIVPLYTRVHLERLAVKIGAYGNANPASSIESLATFNSGDGRFSRLTRDEKVTFSPTLNFYITNRGITRPIASQKDLIKCFSSDKELLRKELEKQKTKFNSIESVKKIVDWINLKGIRD